MKKVQPLPTTGSEWFDETVRAYEDAREALPFTTLLGEGHGPDKLFHLAPAVCVKFRGLPQEAKYITPATDAALSSYVANEEAHGLGLRDPFIAFAFGYLAAHFGLNLIDEDEVQTIMSYIEERHATNGPQV